MEIQNPYLDRKRQLIIQIDREKSNRDIERIMELEKEFKELEIKERVLWDRHISQVSDKIEKVQEQVKEVKVKYRFKKDQRQEIIRLKRIVQGRVLDGKLIQKGIIHELREMGRELK